MANTSLEQEPVKVRLDANVHQAMKEQAARERRTLAAVLFSACREYLERREGKS